VRAFFGSRNNVALGHHLPAGAKFLKILRHSRAGVGYRLGWLLKTFSFVKKAVKISPVAFHKE
jgi:hypothetical protein